MSLPDPEAALAKIQGTATQESKDEDLPAVKIIEIDVPGRRGQRYVGRFHYTVPTIGQQIQMGALKAAYLPAGAGGDTQAASLADILAYLTVTITFSVAYPKPKCWDPLNVYNAAPSTELYGRCLAYEARFHGEDSQERDVEEDARREPDDEGASAAPVGRKVQAPPKRPETLAGKTE